MSSSAGVADFLEAQGRHSSTLLNHCALLMPMFLYNTSQLLFIAPASESIADCDPYTGDGDGHISRPSAVEKNDLFLRVKKL